MVDLLIELVKLVDIITLALALILIFYWTFVESGLSPFVGDHMFFFGVTFINSKHLLVVDEYLWGQSFDNPIMHQRVERCDPFFWVPFEAAFDKILK